MSPKEFLATESSLYSGPLLALWHAGHDNWRQAHEIAQADDAREAAWVHAYLHRVEGDAFNANYWYRRAHRPAPTTDLPTEWEEITCELFASSNLSKP
jgi:hypothetical protein